MDSFSFSRMKSYLPNTAKLPTKLPAMPAMPAMPTLPFSVPQLPGMRTPPTDYPINEKDYLKRADEADTSYHPSSSTSASAPQDLTTADPTFLEPRPIDDSRPKSNLDLVNECDNFPYLHVDPDLYFRRVHHYYHLQVRAHPGLCLGYVLPSVAAVFSGLPEWTVDDEERTLVLVGGNNEEERSEIVAKTCAAMRSLDYFVILKGWRNELYPVHGPGHEVLFKVERAASALLGVASYGAHVTAYVRGKGKKEVAEGAVAEKEDEELRIWVPRRARTKQTYGGMLDNTVAGGLAAGEQPFECIIREAMEEASIPEDIMRSRCKAAGTVSYFHIRDHRAGGETGLLEPECQFVYDMDLTGVDIEPKPEDGEVDEFLLMTVPETQEAMRKGEFKPNCALVLLDFFIRHGILTAENEREYVEIVSRLRRVTEFPTR